MWRRAWPLVLLPVALAACAGLIGIEDLGVDPPVVIGGTDAQVAPDAPADVFVPDVQSEGPPVDAGSRRVFVTSDTTRGAMGGVQGADDRCAAAAARGGLDGGTWMAWLSASGGAAAIDRIVHTGSYLRLDGKPVVTTKGQLTTGNLDLPIDRTESNEPVTGTTLVWTGTFPNGQTSADCNRWTTTGAIMYGTAGSLDRPKNGDWTDNGGAAPATGFPNWGCQTDARLYCFEK